MPFLPPNQQRQSTEGELTYLLAHRKCYGALTYLSDIQRSDFGNTRNNDALYAIHTGQAALAGTSSEELEDFVEAQICT